MTVQVASREAYVAPATVPEANKGYMSGFGNGFETEALPGALPVGRNSPQKCPYGLYAEQLSGSPFTAPRTTNERSWLYRIRPTVMHWGEFEKSDMGLWRTAPCAEIDVPIAPMRWDPIAIPNEKPLVPRRRAHHDHGRRRRHPGRHGCASLSHHALDAGRVFLQRRRRNAVRAATGRVAALDRVRHHRYRARRDRRHPARREDPRIELKNGFARGYLCENYGGAFTLPERGPIGANCLANQRDFLTPVAAYEEKDVPGKLFVKWGGNHVGRAARTFSARRHRLARQLRAVQIRSCANTRRSVRSRSIMPIRRSSRCSHRLRRHPVRPISTS